MDTRTFKLGGEAEVLRLGFGSMRLTGPGVWGEPGDYTKAIEVLQLAVRLGVNFIDTADSYGPEVCERLIAEALYPYPANLIIATKGGFLRPGPGQWVPDGRPKHLKQALEGSLRRLKLEQIDLYQLHTPDPNVPIEDSVGALADMQKQGKIRFIGVSNFDLDELQRARTEARIVSVQNRYNLTERESDPVIDECEQQQMAFIPWFPLGSGELAGPHGKIGQIAQSRRSTPVQIALAWLLSRSPNIIPIPGTSNPEHLRENMSVMKIELSPSERAELEAA